jgi:hypothetical protein
VARGHAARLVAPLLVLGCLLVAVGAGPAIAVYESEEPEGQPIGPEPAPTPPTPPAPAPVEEDVEEDPEEAEQPDPADPDPADPGGDPEPGDAQPTPEPAPEPPPTVEEVLPPPDPPAPRPPAYVPPPPLIPDPELDRLEDLRRRAETADDEETREREELAFAEILLPYLTPGSLAEALLSDAEADLGVVGGGSCPADLGDARARLVAVKRALARSDTIDLARIAAAQERFAALEADATTPAAELRAARAEVAAARAAISPALLELLPVGDPRLPVLEQGVLPVVVAETGALLDGGPALPAVLSEAGPDGVGIAVVGLASEVRAQRAEGSLAPVLGQGRDALVRGFGFAPGTRVSVWLHSVPQRLGVVTVGADGAFSTPVTVPRHVAEGDHTLQVAGAGADCGVVALATGTAVTATGEPASPGLIAAAAAAVAAVAAAGAAGAAAAGAAGGPGTADISEDVLDALAGAEFDLRTAQEIEPDWGDRLGMFTLWPLVALDLPTERTIRRLNRRSPLLAKLLGEGIHLRAMLGTLGFAPLVLGLMLGLASLARTLGTAEHPPIPLFIALVVLGLLDGLGGAAGVLVFVVGTLLSLETIGVTELRLMAGVLVAGFGPIVIARSTREFRREPGLPVSWSDRIGDVAFPALVGGWVASLIFRALPALTGIALPAGDHVATVRVAATAALVVRALLELAAFRWYPFRLELLTPDELPDPYRAQPVVAGVLRLGAFLFVASAFMGTGVLLWIAAGLFMLPTLVGVITDRLPNVAVLHDWLPVGLPALAFVLGLEILLEGGLAGLFGDRPDFSIIFVMALFTMLGVLGMLEALGRDGEDRGWRRLLATDVGVWVQRIGGVVTFALIARFTFIL